MALVLDAITVRHDIIARMDRGGLVKKPQVRTKKFLDWIELKPFLEKNGIKTDRILSLIADYGGVHNGSFHGFERPEPGMYEPPIQKLVEFLFEQFPDAVEGEAIELHIWW